MKLTNIFKPISSILNVKAVGSIKHDVENDLSLPDGMSIENLIQADEQKKQEETDDKQ